MRNKLTVNNSGLKNIIQKSLGGNVTLSNKRIDSIIKEYLTERSEDGDDYPNYEEKTEFRPKSTEAIEDMVSGLKEMAGDLEIIKEKESDVLVYQDQYADEVLTYCIKNIEDIIDDLEDLIDVTKNNKEKRGNSDLY